MKAGDLRHLVTIQTKTLVADSFSAAASASWSTYTTAWAAIWPLKSAERMESMKLEHEVTHKIRIRYQDGITAKMRIKNGSRYFDIISIINPDERNIYLEILATETSE